MYNIVCINYNNRILQGPELFHFEARVVTNSSFCNLTTNFAVSSPHMNQCMDD